MVEVWKKRCEKLCARFQNSRCRASFPTNSWFIFCLHHIWYIHTIKFLTNVHHANEPRLKCMPVNGGYGGVVIYAMHRLLHLLRGPHRCRFRQSMHENVLTKMFSRWGDESEHNPLRPTKSRQRRAGRTEDAILWTLPRCSTFSFRQLVESAPLSHCFSLLYTSMTLVYTYFNIILEVSILCCRSEDFILRHLGSPPPSFPHTVLGLIFCLLPPSLVA